MDATIYDYARFCRAHHSCMECPIQKMSLCVGYAKNISDIDEVNKKKFLTGVRLTLLKQGRVSC